METLLRYSVKPMSFIGFENANKILSTLQNVNFCHAMDNFCRRYFPNRSRMVNSGMP